MSLSNALHQESGQPEPKAMEGGEAAGHRRGGEARLMTPVSDDSGRGQLLVQALTRDNVERAWKRVKTNGGSAGVDGWAFGGSHGGISA